MRYKDRLSISSAALIVCITASIVFGAGQTINVPVRELPQPATVSIIKDDAVNYNSMVSQALEAALGPGGISNLVGPGKTVLIKPNLVSNSTAAVTDWKMVRALVDQIKAVNDGAAITIAEGCASNSSSANTKQIMAAQGFTEANFPGVALVDLNSLSDCPTNYFVLADGASDNTVKQVAERIYLADVVINCPKMKTHYHAGYTGALKNIGIGVPSWSLWNTPGSNTNKGGLHNDIRREILDHVLCRVPDLTLMDAISPMEGQGPVSGNSVTMNLILASKDPVAIDAVACNIMDIPPYLITYMVLCANENVGIMDMNHITITGNTTIAAVKRSFTRATAGGVTPPYELAAIPYRATTVIRIAPEAVTIDGDMTEWSYANPISIDAADQVKSGNNWNGPSDCSLTGMFMWDETNLYVGVHVRDNVKLTNGATGSSIPNGEGIELYISTYPKQYDVTNARGSSYMSEYDHRIAISYASVPQAWILTHNRAVSGFAGSKIETADGYIIEARIPWSSLNNFTSSRYRQIGLNVAINDADVSPTAVSRKLYWNAANQSDVETSTQKLGMSYLDPAGGIYGTETYTMNVTAENGSVAKTPDQSTYNKFSTVSLTATPGDGYSFAGWSGDISGISNPVTVFLNGNKNITAKFSNSALLNSIVVSPSSASINASATAQFSAVGYDKSGNPLEIQPVFTWSVSGGNTISSDGLFNAGITAGTYVVTAASGNISGTASVTVLEKPLTEYQINCGSNSAVSPFTADQFVSGGTMRTITDAIDLSGVSDPAPHAVYQSERYGTQTYTIPGLTASSEYTVRLHMAELYQTATGKRVFNVAINGTTVLSNFDIYAITGARYKAIVREFTTKANS
ncbi:MAG: DUF362 domain-containing protein, partial [Fibrobacter sp.]|nr:DUF362 domain-containing protein [Fibrobacter sp.]